MSRNVAIVGVGFTALRPLSPEVSYKELMFEAAVKAYEDAGVDPRRDVDSFVTVAEDFIEGTSIFDEYVPDQLGAALKPVHTIGGDGLHGSQIVDQPQGRRHALLPGAVLEVLEHAHPKASVGSLRTLLGDTYLSLEERPELVRRAIDFAFELIIAEKGDNLTRIAVHYNMNVSALARANGLKAKTFMNKLVDMSINNTITFGLGAGACALGFQHASGSFFADPHTAHTNKNGRIVFG